MAREASALIGSGTVDRTRNILTPAQRGTNANSLGGYRTGTQVVLANPEDINSVDAFATSGVPITSSAVEVIGPHINPLSRCRTIVLENTGAADVLIGNSASFQDPEGFILSTEGTAGRQTRIELPLMHNVSIWARTAAGTSNIRFIVY